MTTQTQDTTSTETSTLRDVVAKMTALEKAVTVAHLDAGMECNGAETLDAMRADNMTYADVAEIATRTSLTKKQVQGVIASLSTKGILSVGNEKPNGQPGVDQVLTDWGVVVAFDLLAEGVEAKAKAKAKTAKPAPKAKADPKAGDRVILAPGKADDVKPTKVGSKRHLMAEALAKGATIEELMALLSWNRDTVSSALRTDMGAVGLGVERKGGRYFLLLPKGMTRIPARDATTTREDARVAACK